MKKIKSSLILIRTVASAQMNYGGEAKY